jgi:hypothetical protein
MRVHTRRCGVPDRERVLQRSMHAGCERHTSLRARLRDGWQHVHGKLGLLRRLLRHADSHLLYDPPVRTNHGVSMRSTLIICALFFAACGGDTAEGHVECSGASCVCPSSGDCLVDCSGSCDLQCAGSGRCDFICGPDCLVACTGSGPCIVDVGQASTVSCPGSGGCDVVCHGDCNVACPGSGECIVECEPGFECSISQCSGSTVSCPNGIEVCGGACPP